jgi:hypothetical protein
MVLPTLYFAYSDTYKKWSYRFGYCAESEGTPDYYLGFKVATTCGTASAKCIASWHANGIAAKTNRVFHSMVLRQM